MGDFKPLRLPPEKLHQQNCYEFAVEHSPSLAYLHIVKIVLPCLTLKIAEVRGQRWFRSLMLILHFIYDTLYFGASPGSLVLFDYSLDSFLKLVGTVG